VNNFLSALRRSSDKEVTFSAYPHALDSLAEENIDLIS